MPQAFARLSPKRSHIASRSITRLRKPWSAYAHNRLQCNLHGENLHFFLDTHIEVPVALRQFEALTRDTPGKYRIRVTTESQDTTNGEDLIYSVWIAAGGKRKELLGHFDAKHRQASVVELTRSFERGETIIIAPYRMAKVRIDAGYSVYLPDKPEKIPKGWHFINNPNPPIATVGPAIVVKPVEVTGPLHDSWPPAGHRLLYGDDAELAPAAEIAKSSRVPDAILRPIKAYRQLKDPLTVRVPADKQEVAIRTALTKFVSRAFRRRRPTQKLSCITPSPGTIGQRRVSRSGDQCCASRRALFARVSVPRRAGAEAE